jgi:uncharacterized protein (TIGR02996 family)
MSESKPQTPGLPESELTAFLAAIQANTGEDTVRLAFADWLEEHDDPRSEWVRDVELWEWMAPDLGEPVTRILAALANPAERRSLWQLFNKFGPTTVPVVRAWVRELPDERFPRVYDYLKQAHPPELAAVATLMNSIRTGTWYDVWEAVVDLGFHGPAAAEAVDLLLKLPEHTKWDEFSDRYHRDENPIDSTVARTLAALGPAAKKAAPMLAESGWYNESAWDALLVIKPDPLVVVDNLNTDEDEDTLAGMRIAVRLDPTRTGALIHAVKNHTGRIRNSAAQILAEMGAEAADAVPALIETLLTNTKWDREYARAWLLHALRGIGAPARAAVPALRAALKTGSMSSQARVDLGVALAQLGEPDDGWATLSEALGEMEPEAQNANLKAVAAVASTCEQAIPYLFAALAGATLATREAAAMELQGLPHRNFLPDQSLIDWVQPLLAALADNTAMMQWRVASALRQIGERNTPVETKVPADTRNAIVDGLLRVLSKKTLYESARSHTLRALDQWGALPASAANILKQYTESNNGQGEEQILARLLAKVLVR